MTPLILLEDCTQEITPFFYKEVGYMIFKGHLGWAMMLDQCSHLHIPLSTGWLEDGCVVCPWHQWKFNDKGACMWPEPVKEERVPVFDIQEQEGILWKIEPQPTLYWKSALVSIHWQDLIGHKDCLAHNESHIVGLQENSRIWCSGQTIEQAQLRLMEIRLFIDPTEQI